MTQTRKFSPIAASLLMILPFGAATADTINGTGGGWQSWSQTNLYQGTAPTPGTPYWNNLSGDGAQGNVGWCLTGGSATCNMANSPGSALSYYGNGTGSIGNMFFTSSGAPMTVSASFIKTAETTADQYDIFGYYIVPASGSPTLVPLFNTLSATVGSTANLNLGSGTNYGFYIENIHGADVGAESDYFFYMDSGINDWTFNHGASSAGPDSLQHFAIFQNGGSYLIGDVDGYACPDPSQQGKTPCELSNQFDYNDFVVSLGPATPEPATAGLLGVSLLLLAGMARLKLRHSA